MSEVSVSRFVPTKILLPIDFSVSSYAALETATELANHYRAEVYLLHVVPMSPDSTTSEMPIQTYPEQAYLRDARSYAGKKLATCVATLVAKSVKVHSMVEIGNDVSGNIMEIIERHHIDMVVISTHGISGWKPLVFGSIAEKVVKRVECPLLLLRAVKTILDSEPVHSDLVPTLA
jgi:nucleotide-binding universal stress UspA family protein